VQAFSLGGITRERGDEPRHHGLKVVALRDRAQDAGPTGHFAPEDLNAHRYAGFNQRLHRPPELGDPRCVEWVWLDAVEPAFNDFARLPKDQPEFPVGDVERASNEFEVTE
jgi:hypothetical protein